MIQVTRAQLGLGSLKICSFFYTSRARTQFKARILYEPSPKDSQAFRAHELQIHLAITCMVQGKKNKHHIQSKNCITYIDFRKTQIAIIQKH